MILIEVFPKDFDGQIIFSPSGKIGDELIDGTVNPEWFSNAFPDLALANVPLSDEQFQQLCGIDWTKKANAEN
jgi:hypothetical protein